MIARVIQWSLGHRAVVLLGTLVVAAAGAWAMLRTPIDAIPDLSDPQVIVMTEWPGQSPQLVEDQVTYPLEAALLNVPRARVVRGMSQFGLSAVYVVFEDDTDLYWARSRVLEYLDRVRDRLPAGATTMLGPDATGVGWVMQYILADTTHRLDLGELRRIQDWIVRPSLASLEGVAEIASLGGFERQFQVDVDPAKLRAFGLPLEQVVAAVRASSADVGSRVLELGGTEYVIRARGRFSATSDIAATGVGASRGVPIRVRDVATVHMGPEARRGIAEFSGMGEVVTGWIVMRQGANPMEVIARVKERMRQLAPTLPGGAMFFEGYDRSGLIAEAISTLRDKLVEESIIVAGVTVLFLLHASSALVALLTIPTGILLAFGGLRLLGMDANIMSLGGLAIAIGAMIDAAIVMVENLHRHIERNASDRSPRGHWQLVADASIEVGPSLFISLLIITVSFVPVFALQAQEGKLFAPLAWTKTLAMAAAALLSVTLVPVLMGLAIRSGVRPESANPLNRALVKAYRPLIALVLRFRWTTVVIAGVMLAVSLLPATDLGSEFMPPLNEGSIMDMASLAPGVGMQQARDILAQRDAALQRVPEVKLVLGKIGRAESATDMAPMSMIETIAVLKDRAAWRPGVTFDSIVAEANAAVRTPGVANMWSMPIRNRLDMLATGIKTSVGVKLFGPNLDTLGRIGRDLERVLPLVTGTGAVYAERAVGGRYLDITIDRSAVARHGLMVGEVLDAASSAVGGAYAGDVIDGRSRASILVRYPRDYRDGIAAVRATLIQAPNGAVLPLSQVAQVDVTAGATLIRSEDAELSTTVYVDVRNRDIGSFVAAAQREVRARMAIPVGYRLEWSGQFEALERATRRLFVVVPLTLAVIALLLYANFRNVTETSLVLLSLPFSLVGGVWLLWWMDYHLSVAVAVGFIALAGIAAETGVVMLVYLDHAWKDLRARQEVRTRADIDTAVMAGAVERVRPKLMTVTAIMAGLVPILWGDGAGSDVMKRIAAPMVGGMVSSSLLTLLVIPALYSLWRERALRRPVDEMELPPGSASNNGA